MDRSLVCYNPWSQKELDTATKQQQTWWVSWEPNWSGITQLLYFETPALPKRGITKKNEKHMQSLQSEHRLTKGLQIASSPTSPPPHLNITLLKSYLQWFLLPSTLCPTIKKKLQNVLKGKKHSLKRQSKHQNQTQQRCWNYQTRNLKQLWSIC